MAVWNNQVRGHVMAIKRWMGWDPTEIVGKTNPMPTEPDNRSGLGTFPGFPEDNPTLSDRGGLHHADGGPRSVRVKPSRGGSDPYAGKGGF